MVWHIAVRTLWICLFCTFPNLLVPPKSRQSTPWTEDTGWGCWPHVMRLMSSRGGEHESFGAEIAGIQAGSWERGETVEALYSTVLMAHFVRRVSATWYEDSFLYSLHIIEECLSHAKDLYMPVSAKYKIKCGQEELLRWVCSPLSSPSLLESCSSPSPSLTRIYLTCDTVWLWPHVQQGNMVRRFLSLFLIEFDK